MSDDDDKTGKNDPPKIDFNEMFDLDRSKEVRDFVREFEDGIEERTKATEALRQVASRAKASGFTADEVRAMRRIAKWRHDDKLDSARTAAIALQRVSKAVQFNLFI